MIKYATVDLVIEAIHDLRSNHFVHHNAKVIKTLKKVVDQMLNTMSDGTSTAEILEQIHTQQRRRSFLNASKTST